MDMWRVSFEFLGIRVCGSFALRAFCESKLCPNRIHLIFLPLKCSRDGFLSNDFRKKTLLFFFFQLTEVSSLEDLFHHSEDFYELHRVDRWIDELAFFPMGDMSPRSVVSIVETDATVSEAW